MKNIFLILAFLLILALYVFLSNVDQKNEKPDLTKKYSKTDLAKYYRVSRQTLQKWVVQFPLALFDLAKWKKTRKFTELEFLAILQEWGDDPKMVLNKKCIVSESESTYKVLRKEVKRKLEQIGISAQTWASCSVFPPSISQKIIAIL